MKKSFVFFIFLLSLFIQKNCKAQNVPDTLLAQLINSECPTCIDMNTFNLLPNAFNLDSLELYISGCMMSFQGLEMFSNLSYLKIQFIDPYQTSDCYFWTNGNYIIPINHLPTNLEKLKIISWGIYTPASFEVTMPSSLKHLYLEGLDVTIDTLSPILQTLYLDNVLYSFGPYPSTLKDMTMSHSMNFSTGFTLPSSVERLVMWDSDGWYAYDPNSLIPFNVSNSNLRFLQYNCNPGNWWSGSYNINLSDFTVLDTLELQLNTSLINLNMPPTIKQLTIVYNESEDWSFLSNLPNTLVDLTISGGYLDSLPVLPNGLKNIDITTFTLPDPLLVLGPLPDSLINFTLFHDSPICFPNLPQGLLTLKSNFVSYTGDHGCIPNHPPNMVASDYYSNLILTPPLCSTAAPQCLTYQSPLVSGIAFIDLNSNGVWDTWGEALSSHAIRREIIPTSTISYIYPNGGFSVYFYDFIDTNTTYVYDVVNTYSNYNPPAATTITTDGTNGQNFDLNMAFTPAFSFDDIEVWYARNYSNQTGYSNYGWVEMRNRGTNSASGNLIANLSNNLSVYDAGLGIANGNQITWNYNLASGTNQTFTFQSLVSQSAQIGDTIHIDFEATLNGTDYDTTNNFYSIAMPVVSSYDPNDIAVDKSIVGSQQVQQGVDLTYTIRFQNTGNAPAINIYLTDSLSANLDPAYLEVLLSSHPNYQIQIINTNDINKPYVLKVIYNNIMLPDSFSNEAGSHGLFAFKIRLKSNTMMGSIIPAKANIYFDFNAPVITNEVYTVVMDPTKTFVQSKKDFDCQIAPNPAHDNTLLTFNSSSAQKVNVSFFDYTGKQVSDKNVILTTGTTIIPYQLEQLSAGIYLVKIIDNNSNLLHASKIVKY